MNATFEELNNSSPFIISDMNTIDVEEEFENECIYKIFQVLGINVSLKEIMKETEDSYLDEL